MANTTHIKIKPRVYPLIAPQERLLAWEKARGIWRGRKPDPIRELAKMRRGWERKLPKLP